jgi:hypothetical protein
MKAKGLKQKAKGLGQKAERSKLNEAFNNPLRFSV